MMDLPSNCRFESWNIRYGLRQPNNNPTQDCIQSVVFVHGTPWSAVFHPIVEALLARGSYRTLVYDLPGYGQSQDFEDPEDTHTATKSASACLQEILLSISKPRPSRRYSVMWAWTADKVNRHLQSLHMTSPEQSSCELISCLAASLRA